jgi:hypothetical protein
MERSKVPLLIENVDIDRYKVADRKIRHALPKSTPQLGGDGHKIRSQQGFGGAQ